MLFLFRVRVAAAFARAALAAVGDFRRAALAHAFAAESLVLVVVFEATAVFGHGHPPRRYMGANTLPDGEPASRPQRARVSRVRDRSPSETLVDCGRDGRSPGTQCSRSPVAVSKSLGSLSRIH